MLGLIGLVLESKARTCVLYRYRAFFGGRECNLDNPVKVGTSQCEHSEKIPCERQIQERRSMDAPQELSKLFAEDSARDAAPRAEVRCLGVGAGGRESRADN